MVFGIRTLPVNKRHRDKFPWRFYPRCHHEKGISTLSSTGIILIEVLIFYLNIFYGIKFNNALSANGYFDDFKNIFTVHI